MRRVVCFGPGPLFKGGIQNYNSSLAKALSITEKIEVTIISWTQQYPAIFPRDLVDRTSKSEILSGTNIKIEYITNYNNPITWKKTVDRIVEIDPEFVIFQWSIAIQGLPLGWIAKRISQTTDAEIIFDCHFVIQKEGSKIDSIFTKYGLSAADTFITHASQTTKELQILFKKKNFEITKNGQRTVDHATTPIIELYHPVYDLFTLDSSLDIAGYKRENGLKEHVFLFFGFIRKYKGLHDVIRSFKVLSDRRDDVSLLICGESFWETLDQNKLSTKVKNILFGIAQKVLLKKKEKESDYRPLDLIAELNLTDKILLKNEFIPNEDVQKYFQVSDAVLVFYEYATPSGVESISYNFKKPLLATAVGHFPETIDDGVNGYLADPGNIDSMANIMEKNITHPIDPEQIDIKVKDMSWANYAKAIVNRP